MISPVNRASARVAPGMRLRSSTGPPMPTTPDGFNQRLDTLKGELVAQGERVQRLLEEAFRSTFARDAAVSARIQAMDDEVDRVDVELEKASVALLSDATGEGARLEPAQLRAVLTIVKINNELERIADGGVSIAEQASALAGFGLKGGAG